MAASTQLLQYDETCRTTINKTGYYLCSKAIGLPVKTDGFKLLTTVKLYKICKKLVCTKNFTTKNVT